MKAAFDELGTAAPKSGECRIYPLTLSGGFQYPEIKVAVIASGDVYGAKSAKGKPKKQQGSRTAGGFWCSPAARRAANACANPLRTRA